MVEKTNAFDLAISVLLQRQDIKEKKKDWKLEGTAKQGKGKDNYITWLCSGQYSQNHNHINTPKLQFLKFICRQST